MAEVLVDILAKITLYLGHSLPQIMCFISTGILEDYAPALKKKKKQSSFV